MIRILKVVARMIVYIVLHKCMSKLNEEAEAFMSYMSYKINNSKKDNLFSQHSTYMHFTL
jgi:hypothetical protein